MSSFLKRRSVVQQGFRYISNRVVKNDLKRDITCELTVPFSYLNKKKSGRQYLHIGGFLIGPAKFPFMRTKPNFGNLKGIFHCVLSNGKEDKDKTDRDREVKKFQDLRQRGIDHIFDQESVWKAMKERDTLLRRGQTETEKDTNVTEKSDNDADRK